MGILRLNSSIFIVGYDVETIFELVEVAGGGVFSPSSAFIWGDFGHGDAKKPLSATARTEIEEKRITHVMWIVCSDGVAYRQGFGTVFTAAWQRPATEEVDSILG